MNFCLFTVKPVNSTSKKYFNKYTKEVLFKTKWDSSWLSPSFTFEGDLVSAYPQLKEVVVKELDADDPSAGKADFFWSEILLKRVGQSEDDVMSTLIHEVQHFLQSFDGRDCGASVGEYLKKTKDTSLAEALYYFNVGEMEAREAEGQPTQYVDSQFVNTAKTVDMVVEKLTGVRPKGAFFSFFEKLMGKSECRGATMQLYTKRPLSLNSELTVSPLTGEDIYVTPWTDDWLTSGFELTGDLLKYFRNNRVPKIRPMTSQEETADPSTAGWYSPFFCTIVFKNSTEGLSTIVHELQHALHTRELPSLPGSNSVLTLQTAPRRTTVQGSAGVLHTRQRARCKCPLRGCLRLWRALYVPRRTGKRSDDAELHTRELPSVGGPFEGKSPHGAVLWLLNVATGWRVDNRLTACVRIQSVGGPFEN